MLNTEDVETRPVSFQVVKKRILNTSKSELVYSTSSEGNQSLAGLCFVPTTRMQLVVAEQLPPACLGIPAPPLNAM